MDVVGRDVGNSLALVGIGIETKETRKGI